MERIYTLTELPNSRPTEVGLLLRRFIEYADSSALHPLFDLLQEQNRTQAMQDLLYGVGRFLHRKADDQIYRDEWERSLAAVERHFCIDLYGVDAIAYHLGSLTVLSEDAPTFGEGITVPDWEPPIFTAEETIPIGSQVALDNVNNTVRIHPTQPET